MSPDVKESWMASCGGRPMMRGGERSWWFGWNPSDPVVTAKVTVPHDPAEDIPLVQGDRVVLYRLPYLLNGRKHVPYSWQLTGSCVNSGAQNCLTHTIARSILALGKAGGFHIPFTLAAYGYSRWKAFGRDSEGEGSTGDDMAAALADPEMGYTAQDFAIAGMPKPQILGCAYHYTSAEEMRFSARRNCPADVKAACKAQQIRYIVIKSCDQLETEIRRLRPATIAGNWGSTMQMGYRGTGERRVLFGEYADSWEHQMSVEGLWHHPDFGRLWNIRQNWYQLQGGVAVPVHGMPGTDEPPGSFWVDDSMILHQLNYRFGEIRAYADDTPFSDGLLHHMAI